MRSSLPLCARTSAPRSRRSETDARVAAGQGVRERGDLLEVLRRVGGVDQLRVALEQPGEARAVAQPGGGKDVRQGAVRDEQAAPAAGAA